MMSNRLSGISFIIPAYNEERGIVETVLRVKKVLEALGVAYEVIVVNDGSRDNTKIIVEPIISDSIKLISHPINIGYGNAIKTGIMSARFEIIGITDADGTYPIEDISLLYNEIKAGFDMVIGSRGNTKDIDKVLKKIFRWVFKKFINYFVNAKIEDANSGFRLFKKSLALDFFPFLCGTFSFTTSLTILAFGKSYFIKYVPIQYSPRIGRSKVNHLMDSIRTFQYIVQGVTFYNPIKFFIILLVVMVFVVCIPAMILAMMQRFVLSQYLMIFGSIGILLMALGVLGDIIRISWMKK
ncbi:MAG: glycosyltransferase family 2 protein [Oligoflexia bacterium]|nr:glycosyltransferase family 2 protein [Oligoflexia bacterium]